MKQKRKEIKMKGGSVVLLNDGNIDRFLMLKLEGKVTLVSLSVNSTKKLIKGLLDTFL